MDWLTVGIGAALVVAQGIYIAPFWHRPFKHPLSAAVLICGGGVLLVVVAFAVRAAVAPPPDPVELLIQYVAVGGAPELAWALLRRDRDLRAAHDDALSALRGH